MTKIALFAVAAFLVGCVTEPKTITREYEFDCIYITEADSTVTPKCHADRVN